LESLVSIKREISNICELYNSHRLYVIYNIVKLYYMGISEQSAESLKAKELEIESILQEMNRIFQKYSLDTFYQNIKFISDFIYFESYQRTGNQVRADFYHDKSSQQLDELCSKHFMSFHVIRFLESKIEKFLADGNIDSLTRMNQTITQTLDIDCNETYQFV